jgi:kynureninase
MKFENSLAFAKKLDRLDPLKKFRNEFHLPRFKGKPAIYFTGNSLGLQPKSVKKYIQTELDDWATLGVEGHVHATHPWVRYQNFSRKTLAKLAGAKPTEVVAMNHLTVNLHLLMVSFYRPTAKRYKIIAEAGAFSSDQYVFESQIKFYGLDPSNALIEIKPVDGESCIRTEDIIKAIVANKDELALVLFGGVQYYTGQFFDLKKITKAGHDAGAIVGFDLAHAIGNVPLNLHTDDVDFAVWCSYKYLNSGPGAIAGAYVHEKFHQAFDLPRFAGWWGHHEEERFQMRKGFKPMTGVDGWQLSNHPVVHSAVHLAALDVFERSGIIKLRKKSEQLTGYLEFLLKTFDPNGNAFKILTPSNKGERGCQLSIFMNRNGKKIFKALGRQGVFADWREPGVIRVAPVPLYNTFEEVFRFTEILTKAIGKSDRIK